MAGATSRYDYYVNPSGELIKRKSLRPKGRGRWPKPDPEAAWAVSVELRNGVRTTQGPQWTAAREAQAIVRTVYPHSTGHDLGQRLPPQVRRAFGGRMEHALEEAAGKIRRRWQALHTENAMVGVLVGELDGLTLDVDGWSVTVDAQTFSDKVKEPIVGADLGWRIEIRAGAEETVKGILMQAKKAQTVDGWERLPDLTSQMTDMGKLTRERYGLIFTPNGIATVNDHRILPLLTILEEAVVCQRGDQSSMVVANVLDATHVVTVDIEHAS